MKMIECATCGYPLTEDEQAGLVEINNKMHKPWVGLTDQEVAHMADSEWEEAFVRLIEAKLKEKNT